MIRGLVRAAEFHEQAVGGTIWDDESRAALEQARKIGWGHDKTGELNGFSADEIEALKQIACEYTRRAGGNMIDAIMQSGAFAFVSDAVVKLAEKIEKPTHAEYVRGYEEFINGPATDDAVVIAALDGVKPLPEGEYAITHVVAERLRG